MARGVVTTVENKRRRVGAAKTYLHVEVEVQGEPVHLLLTHTQMEQAMRRAANNAEDWPAPEPGMIQRVLGWLRGKND